jgi:hypothetical protein
MTQLSMADIASIAVAIATLVLAFFTYLSVRQARDAQRALARPVLIPPTILQSKEIQNGQATNLDIENVGPGVATDIWVVLFPHSDSIPGVPAQLSFRDHLPLRLGERRRMPIMQGGTMFSSKDRVGGVSLTVPAEFAPEASGLPDPRDRRPRVIGRLTLTCRDSLGLKWSFAYDLDWTDHWISINTGTLVQKDLRDLDAEKSSVPTPRLAPPAA